MSQAGGLEPRLLDPAKDFFVVQSKEEQGRLAALITAIAQDPTPDGMRIFDLPTGDPGLRALATPEYTIYFRVLNNVLQVATISATTPDLRQKILSAPWQKRPPGKASKSLFGLRS